MKLSKTQQELLDAMTGGAVVDYMPYAGTMNPCAYYWRMDTGKRCTAAAQALKDKGLVEAYDESWRGHKLRVKTANL